MSIIPVQFPVVNFRRNFWRLKKVNRFLTANFAMKTDNSRNTRGDYISAPIEDEDQRLADSIKAKLYTDSPCLQNVACSEFLSYFAQTMKQLTSLTMLKLDMKKKEPEIHGKCEKMVLANLSHA